MRLQRTERRAGRSRSVVSRAVSWFLGWSLLALLVLGIGSLFVANVLAKDAALRDATLRGSNFGRGTVAPLLDGSVRAGPSVARAKLDAVIRERLREGTIVHAKIWSAQRVIIWADERTLVGQSFPAADEVTRLMGSRKTVAAFSDLDGDDNALERSEGPLLEVFTASYDADGAPFVLETYWTTDRLNSDEQAIRRRIMPVVLGALVLFELAILPLALTLARRVDRARAERSAVLAHALATAHNERRRLAQDLHDGLLQDLAGLGYALPSVSAHLPPDAELARAVIDDAASMVDRDMTALRALLTDVYPADLTSSGLRDAVTNLARRSSAYGLVVDVRLDDQVQAAGASVAQLTYQVLREGLRNVVKHAAASKVELSADVVDDIVTVSVSDDGRGITGAADGAEHLGLRLLHDSVRDAGGALSLRPGAVGGTVLTATFRLSRAGSAGMTAAEPLPL